MKTRQQLFEELGLSKEVAAIATQASYKEPAARSPEEKQAIHQASEAIFNAPIKDA